MATRYLRQTLPSAKVKLRAIRKNAGQSDARHQIALLIDRYLHFQVVPTTESHPIAPPIDPPLPPLITRKLFSPLTSAQTSKSDSSHGRSSTRSSQAAQWINCDIRSFDYSVLGQFQVIVADPPWDIHMSLPYGTMTDDEMRRLPLAALQPDWGILALWVTGRAMELGRELFGLWGYRRVDELVWVKTNQLQRLIRTGRTGHWLKWAQILTDLSM